MSQNKMTYLIVFKSKNSNGVWVDFPANPVETDSLFMDYNAMSKASEIITSLRANNPGRVFKTARRRHVKEPA